MRPLKTSIYKIDYIEDSYSLILQSDNHLYFYDTGLKQLTELYKSISHFYIERNPKNTDFSVYISNKNKIKRCNLTKFLRSKDKSDIQFEQVLQRKENISYFQKIGNNYLVYLEKLSIQLLNPEKTTKMVLNQDENQKLITILEDNLIMICIKFPIDKNHGNSSHNSMGIFLDRNGGNSVQKNSLNIISEQEVLGVIGNKKLLVFLSQGTHYVYSQLDNTLIQKLTFDRKNEMKLDFYQERLYGIDRYNIYAFQTLSPIDIYQQALDTLFYKPSISVLNIIKNQKNRQDIESKIDKIYFDCGWKFLERINQKNYLKPKECFIHINFDPEEILQCVAKEFLMDLPFEISAIDEFRLKFLEFLFIVKRKQLLLLVEEDPDYIISSEEIMRKNSAINNVRAKSWLSIIDYALIRIYIKRKNYHDLFKFLQQNVLYCVNRNDHLVEVVRSLEAVKNENNKVFIMINSIMVELQQLIGDYKAAMENLRLIQGRAVKKNSKSFIDEKILEILKKNQKGQHFKQLFSENFLWISASVDRLISIFNSINKKFLSELQFLAFFDLQESDPQFTRKDQKRLAKSKLAFIEKLISLKKNTSKINEAYFQVMLRMLGENPQLFEETLLKLIAFSKKPENLFNCDDMLVFLNQCQVQVKDKFGDNNLPESLFLHLRTILLKRINTKESHQEAL